MTLIANKRFRIHVMYVPYGRKFYYDCTSVHWGRVRQIGLWPFVLFIDVYDDYDLAHTP